MSDDSSLSDATPASAADRLTRLVAPYRAELRLGAAAQTAASLLWPLQALILAHGLHGLVDPWKGLSAWAAAAGFLAVGLGRAALDDWGARRIGDAAQAVKQSIRAQLLDATARWSPTDARRPNVGATASLAAEALEAIEPYLTRFEPAKMRLMITPALMLLAIAMISWPVAALLSLAGLAIPVMMAVVGIAAKRAADRQLGEMTEMNAFLLERVRAAADIRLLDAAERTARSFDARSDRVRAETMSVLKIAFLSSASLELAAGIGVALAALAATAGALADPATAAAIGVAPDGFLSGLAAGGALSLWAATMLAMLAPEAFQPFREFATAYHDRAAALAVADRVGAALEASAPTILGDGRAAEAPSGAASVRFEAVSFAYDDGAAGAPAVEGLSFEIAAGEHVGLAGPSGAGKSTVLALIAGLASPSAGRIFTGDAPLDHETADGWRARAAWIGQQPHFPAGSLRANVALFGHPSVDDGARRDARVRAALETAAAGELADARRGGLGAALGETGAGLSGGEGRRVALARLAYADREVILADEPTADLDAETRDRVIDGLLRVAEGRTLIVASHDPALLERLDRVIKLDGASARGARGAGRRGAELTVGRTA